MKINIQVTVPHKQAQNCLLLGIYTNGKLTTSAQKINDKSKNYITKLVKRLSFQAKRGQVLPIFHIPDSDYEHILLIGCGDAGKIDAAAFKQIIIAALKNAVNQKASQIINFLSEIEVPGKDIAWKVKQISEISTEALYRFDEYKSEKDAAPSVKELIIHVDNEKDQKKCQHALKQAAAIAEGVTFAKNLGNTPSNICTPTYLAKQAQLLAKRYKHLSVKVLEEKDMKKMGMGAILGVTKGSAEPAKLIVLEYRGGAKHKAPIALVGKGITFDTGGNSLKPADSMVGMKYDMCGAATVLGTLNACAELALPLNVVGIIPAVENMPGGNAYKPEDILTSMAGKTIEVISTDAEGRLVLADALTYSRRFKPDVVIDIATLTGAVVIALGFHATGLLSNNQKLADDLLKAGEESNDRAWQLPLWDVYQEQIKSPFADIANTGGRSAGAITAACFLSHFTKDLKWAHLDVAGTAAMMMGTAERRATGRPVPLLMQYLIDRA